MALKVGELFASLNLKDEGFSSGLSEAESAMNGAAKSMQSSSDSIFKGLLKMDIFKKVAGMVMNGAKSVLAVGQSFEATMSGVGALSGAGVEDMQRLEEAAKHYGATTSFSATQAAEAMQYMALAGWDTEKTLAGLPGVLNLAAASGMDLGRASDAITDYLSAFGLAAEDAAGMADMMAYAQAHSNTSAQALSDAYGNCASTMHGAGQDIQTTTAMLMLLADQGLKGSEAGTAMSAVMRDMTQKMENGAIKIGNTAVAVQDAQGNFRDLNDIMADVEAATAGMGSAAKQAALMETFTARSIKAVNMVMTAGTGKLGAYEDALRSATGTGEEQAGKMLDNLQGDIKLFQSAMEGLQLELYDGVSEIARDMVKGGSEIVQALLEGVQSGFDNASLDKLLGGSFNLMDAVGKNIRKAIKAMPKFFSDLGKLAGPFAKHLIGMAGEAVGTFVASLPELLPSLLEGFLQLLAGVASGVSEAVKGIFKAMTGQLDNEEMVQEISAAVDGVVTDASVDVNIDPNVDTTEAEPEISKSLQALFDDVKTTLTNGILADDAAATEAAKEAMNTQIAELTSKITEWENAKMNELEASGLRGTALSNAMAEVQEQAESMRSELETAGQEATTWMDTYSEAPTKVVEAHTGELDAIGQTIEGIETQVIGMMEELPEAVTSETSTGNEVVDNIIKNLFGDIEITDLTGAFTNIGELIGTAITDGLRGLEIGVTDIISAINGALDTITSEEFLAHAQILANKVITSIQTGFGNVVNRLANITVKVINGLKDALGKITASTPELLTAGEDIAKHVFEAIVTGIESVENGAVRIINALGGLLGQALDSAGDEAVAESLASFGETIIKGIAESISQGKESLGTVFDTITENLNTYFTPEAVAKAITNAGSFVQGLWDAINDALTNVGDDDKTLLDSFITMIGTALGTVGSGEVTTALGDFVTKFMTGLGDAIRTHLENAAGIVDAISDMLGGALADGSAVDIAENIGNLGINVVKAIVEAIKKAATGGASLISSLGDLFNTLITGGVEEGTMTAAEEAERNSALQTLGEKVIEAVKTGIDGLQDAAGTLMTAFIGKMLEIDWGKAMTDLGTIASNLVVKLGEAIGSAFIHAGDIVDGITTMIQDAMKEGSNVDLGDSLRGLGMQIVAALGKAIESAVSGAGSLLISIGNLFSTILTDGAEQGMEQSASEIQSDSGIASILEGIGTKLIDALSAGITLALESGAGIADALSKLLSSINWETEAEKIGEVATGLVNKIATEIGENPPTGIANSIGTLLGKAFAMLEGVTIGLGKAVFKWFTSGEVFNALGNAAFAIAESFFSLFKGFVSAIWNDTWIGEQLQKMADYVNAMGKDVDLGFSWQAEMNDIKIDKSAYNEYSNQTAYEAIQSALYSAAATLKSGGYDNIGLEEYLNDVIGMVNAQGFEGAFDENAFIGLATKMYDAVYGGLEEAEPEVPENPFESVKESTLQSWNETQNEILGEMGDGGFTPFVEAAEEAGDDLAGVNLSPEASAAAQTVVDTFIESGEQMIPVGEKYGEGIATGLTGYDISGAAETVASTVKTAMRNGLPSSAGRVIGMNFSQGLANGIRAGKNAVVNAAKSVIEAAIKAANTAQDSGSPSRVTYEIGQFFSQGYINGISNGISSVRSAAGNMASSAVDALTQTPRTAISSYESGQNAADAGSFDYDRLETIVRGLNLVMVANDKAIAQVTARQNKIQSDNEAKRLALATGRR